MDVLAISLKDKDSGVRSRAAEALGKIGDKRAVDSLVAALKDPFSTVRAYAAESLGRIDDARTVDVLVVSLKDQDPGVRASAAESLGKIGETRTVPALTVSLQFDPVIQVRESAAEALKELEKKIRSSSYQPSPVVVGVPVTGSPSEEEETVASRLQSTLDVEDEEIAKKLAQLSKLSDIQYATDRAAYEKTIAEFRKIGEQLCANGGDERMRRVALRVEVFGGRTQDCEMYWAGICGWAV